MDPGTHVLDRYQREVPADGFPRARSEHTTVARQQAGESPLAVLSFELLVAAEGRFQDFSAHRQSLSRGQLRLRCANEFEQPRQYGATGGVQLVAATNTFLPTPDVGVEFTSGSFEQALSVHERQRGRDDVLASIPALNVVAILAHPGELFVHSFRRDAAT